MLMMLDDEFRVWGKTDGKGLVIRSDEPVDFHPINKTANVVRVDSLDDTANVVRVDSLDDAARYVNVATQTVGFYPFERMPDYRDRLASGGAQRIVRLGEAGPSTIGNPHDAMYPLHRFVHWMAHEDGVGTRTRKTSPLDTRWAWSRAVPSRKRLHRDVRIRPGKRGEVIGVAGEHDAAAGLHRRRDHVGVGQVTGVRLHPGEHPADQARQRPASVSRTRTPRLACQTGVYQLVVAGAPV